MCSFLGKVPVLQLPKGDIQSLSAGTVAITEFLSEENTTGDNCQKFMMMPLHPLQG